MPANFLADKEIVIIAYGELKNELRSGKTATELSADVMVQLLAKTGLTNRDIDGFALTLPLSETGNPFYSNVVVENLGIEARWLQITDIGGCSILGNIARAAAALKCGMAEFVFCIHADAPSRPTKAEVFNYRSEFQEPAGYQGPLIAFGLMTDAYDQKYGLKPEALGRLAVAQRNGAVVNENAVDKLRNPITVEDYLNSRVVSDPMRLLDCVMRCDGANGVVVTTLERAQALGAKKMVKLTSYSEITNYDPTNSTPDAFETGFQVVGPDALSKAGMRPGDVDMFHPYDDFLIAVLLKLEQIGFCKRGEGSDFLLNTDLSPTGKLPLNTGGGQISAGQAGLAGGGLNVVEAVRQLMGEAGSRQVPNAKNALVTGIGVVPYFRNWGSSVAMVMEA
jgi:acetyl-CoA acetyltransferase